MSQAETPATQAFIPPTYVGQTVYYFREGSRSGKALVGVITDIHALGMCHLRLINGGPNNIVENARHYSDPWFKDLDHKRQQFGYWVTIPVSILLSCNPALVHELALALKDPANYASDAVGLKVKEYIEKGHTDAQIASYLKKPYPLLNMAVIQQIRAEILGIPQKVAEQIFQNPSPPTKPAKA